MPCSVYYVGQLQNGTIFDSHLASEYPDPFAFNLEIGAFVRGLDLGLVTMRKGERAQFCIHPKYGFGEAGSFNAVPADATLKYTVEMVDFRDEQLDEVDMHPLELVTKATQCLQMGSDYIVSNENVLAAMQF